MTTAETYAAAIKKLAETGEEDEVLFTRISDADASTLAWKASTNPEFRADVLKANERSGMVDTFILAAAKA